MTQAPPPDLPNLLVANGLAPHAARWQALIGGRTNRVWKVETPTGAIICKLFAAGENNPLYTNQARDEFAALRALRAQDIAPEPLALLKFGASDVLIYRYLVGAPWQQNVAEVADLLGRLHKLAPPIGWRVAETGSAALIRQCRKILRDCRDIAPDLPRDMPDPNILALDRTAPIHTDIVPNNILKTPQGLRLIDWQCPALGDPCEDLASFLSPAMHRLYGTGALSAAQVQVFLAAYPDQRIVRRYRALAVLYHWRIAAYCQWKVERGDADYGAAQKLELLALNKAEQSHSTYG